MNQKSPIFKVLLVDDEPDLRSALAFHFKLMGIEAIEAGSGNEALRILRDGARVDLIVSDVRMRDGNGVELLKEITRSGEAKVPFLFMTGFADIAQDEAERLGASALLYKPFEFNELKKAVERVLSPSVDERANAA